MSNRPLPQDLIEALQANRLIEAIKIWRDFTDCTLLEAKIFVEDTRDKFRKEGEKKPAYGPLPKEQLLCKLLKMTTSPNDGEALTAIRKANELLISAGWDWDKLLSSKITVVADPFVNLSTPRSANEQTFGKSSPTPPPPQRLAQPQRTYTASPPPPPIPPPRASARYSVARYSVKPNIYAGSCYCCGLKVDIGAGFVFNASDYIRHGGPSSLKDKWFPICTSCNNGAYVPPTRAKMVFPKIHPSTAPNLSSL